MTLRQMQSGHLFHVEHLATVTDLMRGLLLPSYQDIGVHFNLPTPKASQGETYGL